MGVKVGCYKIILDCSEKSILNSFYGVIILFDYAKMCPSMKNATSKEKKFKWLCTHKHPNCKYCNSNELNLLNILILIHFFTYKSTNIEYNNCLINIIAVVRNFLINNIKCL